MNSELKSYTIKTNITIYEHRKRIRISKYSYEQPFNRYSFEIKNSHGKTICGAIKNKQELFRRLKQELKYL